MLTLRNLMQIPIFQNFHVVAGLTGLNNEISNIGILDYEFYEDVKPMRDEFFDQNSIVLSSLLFAKKNPESLIKTIEQLMKYKVNALAYKPVIFKELPSEVLDFANKNNFPILCFGEDEFFEDIIFEVKSFINKEKNEEFLQNSIRYFIEEEVSKSHLQDFFNHLEKPLEEYVLIATVRLNNQTISNLNKPFLQFQNPLNTSFIFKYKNTYIIILTAKFVSSQFTNLLNNLLESLGIMKNQLTIGYSLLHPTYSEIHLALRESYYANIIAAIQKKSECFYESLKSERLLIELYRINPQFALNYINEYLKPIITDQSDNNLMQTAITYIIKNANIKEIADDHFCHPNTIRYRVKKIRHLIEPLNNDNLFYENLSNAIKIYLLHEFIKENH